MFVRYMITCFGTTFETFTEIESLQGPTTLYGRLGSECVRYLKTYNIAKQTTVLYEIDTIVTTRPFSLPCK